MGLFNPKSWFKKSSPAPRRKRSYAGAGMNRLIADWIGGASSANREIRPALSTLRNRSRELARNHWIAQRALQIYRTQVVGDRGLSLQVRARNIPGPQESEGKLDGSGNRIVEENWKQWTRRGVCEVTGAHSWIDIQKLVIESIVRDGEILIHFVRNADNKFRFQLQLLEADFLDEGLNKELEDGKRIVMGVELNKLGRAIAYYLWKGPAHPYDNVEYYQSSKHVRVPAENLLHVFHPERAEQTRGVPLFSGVLNKIQMLDGFEEAELVASRLAASKSLFLKSDDSESGYDGDSFEGNYAPVMDAEPGSITSLPPGVDLAPWNPDHPTSAYADFHKSVLRGISSGIGLDYVSVANNLEGVSYSSIRQGTIDTRDNFRMNQRFLIEHVAEPIYREWLKTSIISGALPFPINRFDKFANAAEFRGRGYQWVDPSKEVRASIDALNNGFISYSDVQMQYGRDPEEVFSSLQSDKDMAERYGIKLALEPLGSKAPALPEID